ncbi:AAA+ ATPase domain-containing protein [Pseudoscourfieldia marina]
MPAASASIMSVDPPPPPPPPGLGAVKHGVWASCSWFDAPPSAASSRGIQAGVFTPNQQPHTQPNDLDLKKADPPSTPPQKQQQQQQPPSSSAILSGGGGGGGLTSSPSNAPSSLEEIEARMLAMTKTGGAATHSRFSDRKVPMGRRCDDGVVLAGSMRSANSQWQFNKDEWSWRRQPALVTDAQQMQYAQQCAHDASMQTQAKNIMRRRWGAGGLADTTPMNTAPTTPAPTPQEQQQEQEQQQQQKNKRRLQKRSHLIEKTCELAPGHETQASSLAATLELTLLHPRSLKSVLGARLHAPVCALLHGPTGSGKTSTVVAAAEAMQLQTEIARAAELVHSGDGGSSAAADNGKLTSLFMNAYHKSTAPCTEANPSGGRPAILVLRDVDALTTSLANHLRGLLEKLRMRLPPFHTPNGGSALSKTDRQRIDAAGHLIEPLTKPDGNATTASSRMFVVLTSEGGVDSLPEPLRRCAGLVHATIGFPGALPDAESRTRALVHLLDSAPGAPSQDELEEIAARTRGCSSADLALVCADAALACVREATEDVDVDDDEIDAEIAESITLAPRHFENALSHRTAPGVLRGAPGAQLVGNGSRDNESSAVLLRTFDEEGARDPLSGALVGGLADVQRSLFEGIRLGLTHHHLTDRYGMRAEGGALLHGPPGCGKTMIARAVADECGVNFVALTGADLLSRWLGESEKAIRDAFRTAAAAAPCVLFLDEIDALGRSRGDGGGGSEGGGPDSRNVATGGGGGGGAGAESRLLATLLTEMDGVSAECRGKVFVLGATNRMDAVDSALLRPGRLGSRLLYVGEPGARARRTILTNALRKAPLDDDVLSLVKSMSTEKTALESEGDVSDDVDREMEVEMHDDVDGGSLTTRSLDTWTRGFSGAEVAEFARRCSMCALRAELAAEMAEDDTEVRVGMVHVESALRSMPTSARARRVMDAEERRRQKRHVRIVGVAEEEEEEEEEQKENMMIEEEDMEKAKENTPHIAVPATSYARLKALEHAVHELLAKGDEQSSSLRLALHGVLR